MSSAGCSAYWLSNSISVGRAAHLGVQLVPEVARARQATGSQGDQRHEGRVLAGGHGCRCFGGLLRRQESRVKLARYGDAARPRSHIGQSHDVVTAHHRLVASLTSGSACAAPFETLLISQANPLARPRRRVIDCLEVRSCCPALARTTFDERALLGLAWRAVMADGRWLMACSCMMADARSGT